MGSEVNNTMEQSFAERRFVKLFFVLGDHQSVQEASKLFRDAYQMCEEKQICPEYISELELKKTRLDKKVLCVLESFEGSLFDQLRTKPCLILGARCIITCLVKAEPTPNGKNPVFCLAMQGITVCVSGLTNAQKIALKDKVEFMGGKFRRSLSEDVTHLVTNQTMSEKYCVAAQRRIPVMVEQWIHETWTVNLQKTTHALDPSLNSLRCPAFQALRICTSQIPKSKKEHIKKMVESQGGVYCTALSDRDTDILVAGTGKGDKVMAAKNWQVPCVTEKWIEDSYDAGYALKPADYEVVVERTSTPESNKTNVDANFSMMSCISNSDKHMINETISSEMSFMEHNPHQVSQANKHRALNLAGPSELKKTSDHHHHTPEKSVMFKAPRAQISKDRAFMETLKDIENLEISVIKKAGTFLDGCKVYLSGFTTSVLDKVRKILNFGGATRLDQITESVSHVLVAGSALTTEEKRAALHVQPHVVRAEWLLASIKQGHPANVEPFLCYESQQSTEPSPLSKKGLQMWNKKSPVDVAKSATAQSDLHLVKQYIQFDPDSPDKTPTDKTQMDELVDFGENDEETLAEPLEAEAEEADNEEDQDEPKLFTGLKFCSAGMSEEEELQLKIFIEGCGGKFQQENVDYIIVPLYGAETNIKANNVVIQAWLEACVERNEVLPVEYYHKPIQVKNGNKPLDKCVLAISSYGGFERNFLTELSKALGALFQEVFAKKRSPERNAEGSTHLLCPTPSGPKYNAAIKWKLPVVSNEWLLACAEQGIHVSEEPYLIAGSSIASSNTGSTTSLDVTTPSVLGTTHTRTNSVSSSISTPHQPKADVNEAPVLSAVPTRLKAPRLSLGSETSSPQDKNLDVSGTSKTKSPDKMASQFFKTPVSNKICASEFVTPTPTEKGSPNQSAQYATPYTQKTPSQQYTPYTPASIMAKEKKKQETPKTPVSHVELNKMTPTSYQNYWSNKVPCDAPTPETPYGQVFETDPSPGAKKEWKQYLTSMPGDDTPVGRKRSCDDELINNEETKKRKQADAKSIIKESTSMQSPKNTTPLAVTPGPSSRHQDLNTSFSPFGNQSKPSKESKEHMQEKENKIKYRFMITGIEGSDRDTIEELIISMGGEVCTSTSYDSSASHLICTKPARSEKLLASIAAGKWIVHHSFIVDSHKKGHFLCEDAFEWGNPKATSLPELITNKLGEQLASACYRWRSTLQTSGTQGAYTGMKAIILSQPGKTEAFSRLIKAGGGDVLDVQPPFSDPKDATHCFVEDNKMSLIDSKSLEAEKVVVVPPIYLNDFLAYNPSPTPQQWLQNNLSKKK